ncbi:hypothetical protein LOAG_03692 [Loa loa]|uniref:Uncharacterized protein n=1 Tax=Loa loa TaxID=7209 RepID=A0A1S0U4M1_LOALO|nr:hypothetical protein LOAG_03692 [Loa loa]EFO24792.2 hypothetical protein LOAG_03692 [Loa loa]
MSGKYNSRKSSCEVEREAKLLVLLVDIIDQQSLLVGSKLMESDLVIKSEGT